MSKLYFWQLNVRVAHSIRSNSPGLVRKSSWLMALLLWFGPFSNTTAQNPATLAAGAFHSATIHPDGSLWLWGRNNTGQLGDGSFIQRNSPVLLSTPVSASPATAWTQVSLGAFHSAALRSDGTLWTWGDNSSGQLGDGTNINRLAPKQVATPANVSVGSYWTQVATGYAHTLALRSDGTLWTWGANNFGQLGNNTTASHLNPTRVASPVEFATWKSVTTTGYHSLAILSNNTLWAWGRNHLGQLGLTTLSLMQQKPQQVYVDLPGGTWAQVTTGEAHSMALSSEGLLWSWGSNESGQLGNGTTNLVNARPALVVIPEATPANTKWHSIAAGASHSLALRADGSLWSWGEGLDGQLGTNNTRTQLQPVQEFTRGTWKLITAGTAHSLATNTRGLSSTGSSDFGQLGNGRLATRLQYNLTLPTILALSKPVPTFRLYPNPATDVIYAEELPSKSSAQLRDMLGRVVRTWVMNANKFDLYGITPGSYHIVITSPNAITSKLISIK